MRKFSVPDYAKVHIDALRVLISPGIYAASLEDSPLLELPAVENKSGGEASLGVRAQVLIDLMEKIVDERLINKDREAVRMLFGLGQWAGVPARDRRSSVARLRDKHWTWDRNYRKEPLSRDLYMVFLALYREGDDVQGSAVERVSPIREEATTSKGSRSLIEGGDFVMNLYESLYNFPAYPGQRREFLQTREITSLRDGLDAWRQSTHWWGKNTDDLPELRLFGSGSLSIAHDSEIHRNNQQGRIYVSEVRFSQPLHKGERAKFSLVKSHHVGFDDLVRDDWEDCCGIFNLNVPTERAVIGVRFPNQKRPKYVWHFDDLPEWLAPGTHAEDNLVSLDESGFATFSWNHLAVGCSYGLAWQW
ncbi:hypothetical protein F4561_001193 [Lipingzhangella halophila]|uniref:Uncharacterized protein n=1 Tax=Lipingzhangella halophila TaxID=1783352 RepID=A0A7W7W1I7_9ACTN|nr:hypothetical protein [Lipingzhangella halophila]MBB4930373.1 hypothetical protein [Lipingzhangella halophila]